MWGATPDSTPSPSCSADFNPRAPCGARPLVLTATAALPVFQSTRPVWGATSARLKKFFPRAFQSTRPVWGATAGLPIRCRTKRYFNPRAPCGARLGSGNIWLATNTISIHAPRVGRDRTISEGFHFVDIFQSTRPVWGATAIGIQAARVEPISIHAPRVGRDQAVFCSRLDMPISIHAPRVGRDGDDDTGKPSRGISIHAPRVGRDLQGVRAVS